jgi:hypothetical protein
MAAMSGGTAAAWCEPEALLAGMYDFAHLSCSASQSTDDIASFCGILQRSITSLVRRSWRHGGSLRFPRQRRSLPHVIAVLDPTFIVAPFLTCRARKSAVPGRQRSECSEEGDWVD